MRFRLNELIILLFLRTLAFHLVTANSSDRPK